MWIQLIYPTNSSLLCSLWDGLCAALQWSILSIYLHGYCFICTIASFKQTDFMPITFKCVVSFVLQKRGFGGRIWIHPRQMFYFQDKNGRKIFFFCFLLRGHYFTLKKTSIIWYWQKSRSLTCFYLCLTKLWLVCNIWHSHFLLILYKFITLLSQLSNRKQ